MAMVYDNLTVVFKNKVALETSINFSNSLKLPPSIEAEELAANDTAPPMAEIRSTF